VRLLDFKDDLAHTTDQQEGLLVPLKCKYRPDKLAKLLIQDTSSLWHRPCQVNMLSIEEDVIVPHTMMGPHDPGRYESPIASSAKLDVDPTY
jgi:hypothetical protein